MENKKIIYNILIHTHRERWRYVYLHMLGFGAILAKKNVILILNKNKH